PLKIECPDYVMSHMTYDKNGRLLIHLLNYDDGQRPIVTVQFCNDEPSSVEWLTPDECDIQVERTDSNIVCIKGLVNYGVLRCSPKKDYSISEKPYFREA
ncbi:MAG: hypothetical protein Q7J78_06470, partial [Clostridiales bacterium]|nr:hypothetical protein [Clostridiales bacterium]